MARDALAGAGAACQVVKLAVGVMPGFAAPAEQLALAGIDAAHTVKAVRSVVGIA